MEFLFELDVVFLRACQGKNEWNCCLGIMMYFGERAQGRRGGLQSQWNNVNGFGEWISA
jgi:hypothetical protein